MLVLLHGGMQDAGVSCRVNAEVDTGWASCLWLLANMTGLVAGEIQTKQQKVQETHMEYTVVTI